MAVPKGGLVGEIQKWLKIEISKKQNPAPKTKQRYSKTHFRRSKRRNSRFSYKLILIFLLGTKWQDYNLFGNQLVCHYVGPDYVGAIYK